MADKTTFLPDETISLLSQRAKDGGDNFRVKIYRKRNIMGPPDHIATMTGAQVVHIANPEQWIPRLCGGGSFMLGAFPSDNPVAMIGGHLPFTFKGMEKDVDPRVVGAAGWEGPSGIDFPSYDPQFTQFSPTSISPMGGSALHQPLVGAANARDGLMGSGLPSPSVDPNLQYWIRQQEEKFAAREKELAEREARARAETEKAQQALREEKLKSEFEARQRDQEARHAAQMADLKAAILANKPAESNSMKDIAAIFAPILGQIMTAQQESSKQTQSMIMAMLTKSGVSPEMQMVLDVMKTQGGSAKDQIEAMGIVNSTALEMLSTVAEMNLGGQADHPVMAAIKEVMKGLRMMGGPKRPGNGAYPPPQPQPRQPQLPPPGYATQARGQPQAAPQQPRQPQNGQQAAPVQQPVQVQQFNGVPAQAQQPAQQPNVLDELEAMIRSFQPPEVVATKFLQNLKDPVLDRALTEVNGEWGELIAQRLGPWAMEDKQHANYLAALYDEVNRLGVEAGILDPDSDDDDDGQDQDEPDAVEAEPGAEA